MKLGKAFPDSLILESKSQTRLSKETGPSWWLGAGRMLALVSIFFVLFFILLIRLFRLTIIDGHIYRRLSDNNRIRELTRFAPRGNLLDRTGKPLTTNEPTYHLLKPCTPNASDCNLIISPGEANTLKSQGLPTGWFLESDYQRLYPFGSTFAHVAGYTGELSAAELGQDYYQTHNYAPGDRVGRMGAEEAFEDSLRGRNGKELVEVDASGKIIRTLGTQQELPGEDISLSLDADLSRVVASAFPAGMRGAVVVSKPATGEILALYSSPSFDPNNFALGLSQADYQALTNNPDKPLFDRAIGGTYPPGSPFKIVTGLAALMEGAVTAETIVEDTGVINIGLYSFPNWYFSQYGKTDGLVDVVKAYQRSNDIFFYKAGEWLGITKLVAWAKKIGLGHPLGIELSGEAGGLVPDPAWKSASFNSPADKQARNDQWYLGDTYHIAIGQGYLLTTPLQMNAWTNIIANGGKLCRPTILKSHSPKQSAADCKDLGIKKDYIELIRHGMEKACETGGTGWPLFNFTIYKSTNLPAGEAGLQMTNDEATSSSQQRQAIAVPVACKTGTAEYGDPANRTHAWFTAFAPVPKDILDNSEALAGDPEVSVTVLVEAGGEGSNVAAPIAKKILEEWFSR